METRITATEAARTFTDILKRVESRGERFLVERKGKVVCRIEPNAQPSEPTFTGRDLANLLRRLPKPDPEFWDDVEEGIRNQGVVPDSKW